MLRDLGGWKRKMGSIAPGLREISGGISGAAGLPRESPGELQRLRRVALDKARTASAQFWWGVQARRTGMGPHTIEPPRGQIGLALRTRGRK